MSNVKERRLPEQVLGGAINSWVDHKLGQIPVSSKPIRRFWSEQQPGQCYPQDTNLQRTFLRSKETVPVLHFHSAGMNLNAAIQRAVLSLDLDIFPDFYARVDWQVKAREGSNPAYVKKPIDRKLTAHKPVSGAEKQIGEQKVPPDSCSPLAYIVGEQLRDLYKFVDLKTRAKQVNEKIGSYEELLRQQLKDSGLQVSKQPNLDAEKFKAVPWYSAMAQPVSIENTHLEFGTIETLTCRLKDYGRVAEAVTSEESAKLQEQTDYFVTKQSQAGLLMAIDHYARLSGKDRYEVVKIMSEAINSALALTEFEKALRYKQSLMDRSNIYNAKRILQEAQIEVATNLDESTNSILARHRQELEQLPTIEGREKPLYTAALVGEFQNCMEAGSLLEFYEPLAEQGVYVENIIDITQYIKDFSLLHMIKNKIHPPKDKEEELAIRGGNTRYAGGHVKAIASTAQGARERVYNYDGVILLGPFNCIPLIVGLNIVEGEKLQILRGKKGVFVGNWQIAPLEDIPILPLLLNSGDETSKHLQTRLEAFADLMKSRRRKREKVVFTPKLVAT